MPFDLWSRPYQLRSFATARMRLADDVRRCVAFIGILSPEGKFFPAGTCFLVWHKQNAYLVTANHIAIDLGDSPFALRFNKKSEGSVQIYIDSFVHQVRWVCHPTYPDDVDVAVMQFNYGLIELGCDVLYIESEMFAVGVERERFKIGVGDACYTVGLFRVMAGETRNLPVVHTGNIALIPQDERIPVRDWLPPHTGRARRLVEGYLVETQNLKGLSGSPVFIRPSAAIGPLKSADGIEFKLMGGMEEILLLGLWQAAWDAPLDEVLAAERGEAVRVPLGMGIVVPADKIMDVLEAPTLEEARREREAKLIVDNAAKPDTGGAS